MIKGIDVSHHNGHVEWKKLKTQSIEFAFIKASEGLSVADARFPANSQGSKLAGIPRGAYHFYRPNSDWYNQAMLFLKMVEKENLDLPPVLDFETMGTVSSHNTQIDGALSWLAMVEKSLKVRPIIYTSPSIMEEFNHPAAFGSYPLWLAHYGVEHPRIPRQWKHWTFWQYTESGKLEGTGGVDLNWFAGTADDLKLLTGPAVIAPLS